MPTKATKAMGAQRTMTASAKTILIVDDDPDIALVLRIMLEDAGYAAVTADMIGDLMRLLDRERPNLILLDMLLSGVDGREIVRRLKASPATAQIPIILLSAHPAGESGARDAGADAFLAKPFEMDTLLEMVAAHVR